MHPVIWSIYFIHMIFCFLTENILIDKYIQNSSKDRSRYYLFSKRIKRKPYFPNFQILLKRQNQMYVVAQAASLNI